MLALQQEEILYSISPTGSALASRHSPYTYLTEKYSISVTAYLDNGFTPSPEHKPIEGR